MIGSKKEAEEIAVRMYLADEDVDQWLEDNICELQALFQEEMPYGTQKARDGDPYMWLTDRLLRDI